MKTNTKIISFAKVSKIFKDFLTNSRKDSDCSNSLEALILKTIQVNKKIWDLEDSARRFELGDKHVATSKRDIDINNQIRNDLIRQMDREISTYFDVSPGLRESFYSETPGMIIDRLAIIFIKDSVIKSILSAIVDTGLRAEYKQKEQTILNQMKNIGEFLDLYLKRLINNEVYFEVQDAVKLYNDPRVKIIIKSMNNIPPQEKGASS